MDEKLDFDTFTPLYHQLREIIIKYIESGEWKPGDKIPSELFMQKQYNISRNTVQAALDDLVKDGMLERKKGLGTFVTKPKIEQSLTTFYSFSKVMKSKGLKSEDIVLNISKTKASKLVAKQLGVKTSEEVFALQRVRKANNEPIILETSYLPKSIVPDLMNYDLNEVSLYDYLEKNFGIIVMKAKESFEPVLTSKDESKYLEVEAGSPSLMLDRVAYDQFGRTVEFCRSIVRGDRCKFYTELL
ncbi:UTRA domain-containing protein [Aquibacillus halophilus]|uniref:UTRA domain-containing protein n=1 Tax=Aquibacillus halophilus TaxID=930132 RepID=A0A6A8DC82_9BACI|nr:GntR family transcriptional regulator [Aquibacillus halophilus]MRH43293.1 UTRA domain-containing protein [Aquibacillus halophilus]